SAPTPGPESLAFSFCWSPKYVADAASVRCDASCVAHGPLVPICPNEHDHHAQSDHHSVWNCSSSTIFLADDGFDALVRTQMSAEGPQLVIHDLEIQQGSLELAGLHQEDHGVDAGSDRAGN